MDTHIRVRIVVLDLNTDALSSGRCRGKNIVGVLVSMSYEEDEEGADGLQWQRPKFIDGNKMLQIRLLVWAATHREFTNTADGQNGGSTWPTHSIMYTIHTTEWYNSSIC